MRLCCQEPSLAIHTPAKLNLSLEVLGRRPDGYHELETVMVSIGLYDTLLLTEDRSHQTRLECRPAATDSRPGAPGHNRPTKDVGSRQHAPHTSSDAHQEPDGYHGRDNLVVRAAELLRRHTGCDRGVRIDLHKRIPMQAGLGGGSSDAAATLVGLNRFWKLGLPAEELHALAAQLGSDVNFFLDSPLAAACTGRGERITPLTLPQRLHFVVACPQTGLSTRDVFGQWQRSGAPVRSLAEAVPPLSTEKILNHPGLLYNALERTACALNPDVSRTLDVLRRAGACSSLMSGSGSSCFGVCRTARQARTVAGRVRQQGCRRVYAVCTGA